MYLLIRNTKLSQVDADGFLLALDVTVAEHDRAQVERLAAEVQQITGEGVKVGYNVRLVRYNSGTPVSSCQLRWVIRKLRLINDLALRKASLYCALLS